MTYHYTYHQNAIASQAARYVKRNYGQHRQVNRDAKRERVPQEVIDEILSSIKLSDIVRESAHVRDSNDHAWSICPFHKSSSDAYSMRIDDAAMSFKCNECNFGGSAIGWFQYGQGLSFHESLSELAKRAGVDISNWVDASAIEKSLESKYRLMSSVADFYALQLRDTPEFSDYVKSRGIDSATAQRFNLGCAPLNTDSFDAVFKSKFRDLWSCGVVSRMHDSKYLPFFRNRLIFPIRSIQGNIVGFGGRVLDTSNSRYPKYLNSSASNLFDKSNLVYGLYEAISANESRPSFFTLVEGYTDVIALSQHGVEAPVATLGTAVTASHVALLFAHSDRVVACFDGDAAGLEAAERLVNASLPIVDDFQYLDIVILPEGSDPDSFVRENGIEQFNQLVSCAAPMVHFLLGKLSANLDLKSIGGKAALSSIALPYLDTIRSSAVRDSFIDYVEEAIELEWDGARALP